MRPYLLFGLLVASIGLACLPGDADPTDTAAPMEAIALRSGAQVVFHTPLFTQPAVLAGEDEAPQPDEAIDLHWTFQPTQLQVYRSTAVRLRVESTPREHADASCTWNFGDGSPAVEGCETSHTFHGGQADQVVTLHLADGDWTWTSTRTIPLERLAVVVEQATGPQGALAGMPPAPKVDRSSFRFAVIADTAAQGGVPADVQTAVDQLANHIAPELVIHAGGIAAAGEGAQAQQAYASVLAAPLAQRGIALASALSPGDGAAGLELPRPTVQMIDDSAFPQHYTFTHRGAFFLVLSTRVEEGVSDEAIRWMREQLASARIYEARYVVSYLPLHKFGDRHLGSLDKRFRLYELFLRARVTTLFSAGYRVYFKGRYGALPVVSVGATAGPGGRLSGYGFAQPASFVVVDQVRGIPEHVFAVTGPTFDRPMDEASLPETVEVYTR